MANLAAKRLMVLGGSAAQMPLLKAAQQSGCAVIVCDQNPDCPGREFAAKFFAVSTADQQRLLEIGRAEAIDGVTTFASDPSAQAVAYVGNAIGLPSNPYDSVVLMTRKELFREFMRTHEFCVPKGLHAESLDVFLEQVDGLAGDIIIKPSNSSGSRGITKILSTDRDRLSLQAAFERASTFSNLKTVVAEEFFQHRGYQVAGDGFLVDGRLVFRCFANEHFDPSFNSLVPIGESIPCDWDAAHQARAHQLLQDILSKLSMRSGAFNFDFVFLEDGRIFVIEIGPRNGGNLIPEITNISTGVDMVQATIDAALGQHQGALVMKEPVGFVASHVIHVKKAGAFRGIEIHPRLLSHVHEKREYATEGTVFSEDDVSNHRLAGAIILKFQAMKEMLSIMDDVSSNVWIRLG